MAKQQRSIRQTNVAAKHGRGHQLEHTEIFDDSLLPEASEIEKLKNLDPTIIDWLKERATAEQEFRHSAFRERTKIVSRSEKGVRFINILGMTFAFLFLTMGLGFSYLLLEKGQIVYGSIFSGVTLIFGASLFINTAKNRGKENPK